MTREQMGQALEYANPRVSMSIHERNAKRLINIQLLSIMTKKVKESEKGCILSRGDARL